MLYSVTLSSEQIDLIGAGLYELPYKLASPLIDYLRQQVQLQDAERATAEKPAEEAAAPAAQETAEGQPAAE